MRSPPRWQGAPALRTSLDALWSFHGELSFPLQLAERELSTVMVEVLCSVVVDVAQSHRVFEVGVPAHREMHRPTQAGFVLLPELAMQRFDGSFQQLLGSGEAEYCAAGPRAEVVNEMEGRVAAFRTAAKR